MEKQVDYIDRKFENSDLEGVDMVFVAIDDPEASSQIWKLCKQQRIPANIADVPPECDFYFGSVHRDGPLQVMVSTNGNGPKLASMIRKKISATLPDNTGAAIQNVGVLRKKLREVAPTADEGPKRMNWFVFLSFPSFSLPLVHPRALLLLGHCPPCFGSGVFLFYFILKLFLSFLLYRRMSRVCETWSLEELVDMSESDMDALLTFYASDVVPSFEQVRLR